MVKITEQLKSICPYFLVVCSIVILVCLGLVFISNFGLSGASYNPPINSTSSTITATGGTINNTPIGALTPSTGVFTFVTSTDGLYVSSTFSMQNDDGVNNILQRFLTDDEYGDFSISQRSNPNPYSARNNQSFRIGFNTAQGTNRELLTQHALDIAFESFYTQSAGQEVWELHLPSYVDTSGTEWRPLSFQGHLLSSSIKPGNLAAAFTLDNLSLYARTSTSFSGFNIGRGNSTMTMTIAGGSNEILEFGANTAGITRALMGVGGFNQSRGSYVDTFSTGMIIFAGVNSVEHARFSSNGHLLINTTTDNGYLSVSGTAFISGTSTFRGITTPSSDVYLPGLSGPIATADTVCFDAGGKITHQATNCTVSSRRFKYDIAMYSGGLSTVLDLQPAIYKRRSDDVEEIGLIAEEVAKIDPHFVVYEKDGITPRTVDYERLVVPLISAVKDQQKQIEELRLQILHMKK